MIRIRISDDALEDLAGGFWFYESQEAGLGDYFSSQLKADIQRLQVTAGIHRQVHTEYYRLLSRIFPYAVYYTLDEGGGRGLGSRRLQEKPGVDPAAFGAVSRASWTANCLLPFWHSPPAARELP